MIQCWIKETNQRNKSAHSLPKNLNRIVFASAIDCLRLKIDQKSTWCHSSHLIWCWVIFCLIDIISHFLHIHPFFLQIHPAKRISGIKFVMVFLVFRPWKKTNFSALTLTRPNKLLISVTTLLHKKNQSRKNQFKPIRTELSSPSCFSRAFSHDNKICKDSPQVAW